MIGLRRFNEAGLRRFDEFLDLIDQGAQPDVLGLRDDDAFSERVTEVWFDEDRVDSSRFDAAAYLVHLLEPIDSPMIERDRGLWAWVSLAWLNRLAPVDTRGQRTLGARPRYIPVVDDYRTYYRHLLAGPYRIYRAYLSQPLRAMGLLATPLDKPGELVEQFASRQEIVTNANLVGAITDLYYDFANHRLKRGAARKEAGGARRLADIFEQLVLTWDIYAMDAAEIISLLPKEFDEFRPAGPAVTAEVSSRT